MNAASFLLAFWLGIAFSAPPGIINIESIRQGLKGGFWSAFAVGLGSLIGDGTYAVLAFGGLSFIVQNNIIKFTVGLVGISFLVYLAISAFKIKNLPKIEGGIASNKNRTAFINGAILSLTNPWAIAFWLSFGGILISSGISTNSENLWLFLITFLAGATSWVFIFSILIAFGKKFINDKVFHAISFISGLVFLGTAGYAIWKLLII
mgnify:CR=1 FL=1